VKTTRTFPALLEAFFADRLMTQRRASRHTIASYRDTFRLLLRFLQERFNKHPSDLTLQDLSAPVICEFLNYLEKQRGNTARSRNVRLAAIRSFFHYSAFEEPGQADLIQRVLAIPAKRWHRRLVSFLSPSEADALTQAPDCGAYAGRRDHVLLRLAIQTGLRVSEITGLKCRDIVSSGTRAYVRCQGKGRKERAIPLTKSTAMLVKAWLQERKGEPESPLFANARGQELSRDGVAYILKKHVEAASQRCKSLLTKRVSPHVLRHTNAVNLLQAGVDQAVIALWLGHESVETTQVYLHADIEYKEKILAKLSLGKGQKLTYHPDDRLLTFLNSL
jgi:site-specific recombinase XerD